MRLWLAHTSEVPIREQLFAQVVLAILSAELAPGQRLPSTRELARRMRVHANTVSSAYRELERGGWVEFRRGSGVYVRRSSETRAVPPMAALDQMISGLFHQAREKGISREEVRGRLRHWLAAQAPDHFLLVEPDEELRQIIAAEIGQAIPFPVRTGGWEVCRDTEALAGAVLLAMPSKYERVRTLLPPGTECSVLRVRSVPASLAGWLPAPADALVVVASRWPEFLRWARTLLLAAGFHRDALEFRDARKPRWNAGLMAATAVVADTLTARAVPASCRTISFPLLAEATLQKLRDMHRFLTNPLV
jgi:GntR family transcriptional regulator